MFLWHLSTFLRLPVVVLSVWFFSWTFCKHQSSPGKTNEISSGLFEEIPKIAGRLSWATLCHSGKLSGLFGGLQSSSSKFRMSNSVDSSFICVQFFCSSLQAFRISSVRFFVFLNVFLNFIKDFERMSFVFKNKGSKVSKLRPFLVELLVLTKLREIHC